MKTKAALQAELSALNAEIAEERDKYVKGELTPEEVGAFDRRVEEAEAVKAQIEAFPTLPGVEDRLGSIKSFLRQPSTPAPAIARPGIAVKGRGEDPRDHAHSERGGSPEGFHGPALKSLGQLVVEELLNDKAVKGRHPWDPGTGGQRWGREFRYLHRLDGYAPSNDEDEEAVKATITNTTSPLTGYDRQPGIVDLKQRRLMIADLLGQGTTEQPTIRYVQETGFTNAATSVAEGASKPEASLDLEEVDAAVRKVAVWQKISDEMLMDFSQLRSYIDGRLRYMVMQREEALIYGGDGTPPNIRGLTATSGIQTQAQTGGITAIDAIHKAITKIQSVGFDEPDGIVMHPTDWEILRLSADDNGQYMGGGPFYSPYAGSGMFDRNVTIWGLRPVVTTAATAGTALVGAFSTAAQLFRRNGVTVQITNTDQDDFIRNLATIRAESRLALCVYRPLSFCTVTGLTAGTA